MTNSAGAITQNGQVMVAGYQIPIKHRKQQHDNDCWAACSGMILEWKGFVVTHTRILAEGNKVGDLMGQDSPLSTAETGRVIKNLSSGTVQFTRVDSPRTKNADFWIQHLNQHKPVLTSMGNHCRIIMGYNGEGQFAVMDPNPMHSGPIVGNIQYLQANLMDAFVMR
jgi:hypothetical protein